MKKNFITWVFAGVAGIALLVLLNTSPLARVGLTIQLPGGWQSTVTSNYSDLSCNSRHSEGIPFAFKRPNKVQTCTFDTNKLGLLLNGMTGMAIGILAYAFASKKQG